MAYLITGAMGCIGSWTLYHLVQAGKQAVVFDLSDDRSRLNLLLEPEQQAAITFVSGDITDTAQVMNVVEEHGITHIIHLAALQVPACRARPVLGAQVNVIGTVNVFEAARQAGIKHIAYASSIAVYGAPDDYPAEMVGPEDPFIPHTLYGVYKVANEGTAKVYWEDYNISSTTLRAYTVYGAGRDQGLTSEPTKAMLAAAAGKPFHISFGGRMQFHYASDVARQFIEASETPLDGAYGFNLGTPVYNVADVVALIREAKPGAQITNEDKPLPFPAGCDPGDYKQHLNQVTETPLKEGIAETITRFEALLNEGKIQMEKDA